MSQVALTSDELERWAQRWQGAVRDAFDGLSQKVETSLQPFYLYEPMLICGVFVSQLQWSYTKNLTVAALVAGTTTLALAAKDIRARFDARKRNLPH